MRRRDFLIASATLAALASRRPAHALGTRAARSPGLRFGYAAITWGGDDPRAIDEIAALGFEGIQLRASAVERWGEKPDELKSLLAARGLTMVALSSGVVALDPARERETLALHERNARFVRDAGGLYLQVLDERPPDRAPTAEELRRMGRLLSELGRRTADLGVPLGLHNHMGNLSQSPDEVARVLGASDPRHVKLELDVAHWHQAGGDPATAVRAYRDRLLFLHIKDVESPAPGRGPESYRFVELGRGRVNLPAVFMALREISFDGWAVVELDAVPDKARTPTASGEIAKDYLRGLGYSIARPSTPG